MLFVEKDGQDGDSGTGEKGTGAAKAGYATDYPRSGFKRSWWLAGARQGALEQ